MTPLTREERDAVIRRHPSAAPADLEADLDEYEALVVARFATDPSTLPSAEPSVRVMSQARDSRLAELHQKLFGPV